jgi:hypothetical protein
VAIGSSAGFSAQGGSAVAVGAFAGNGGQGATSIAIGLSAAGNTQGQQAIAIGQEAGFQGQLSGAVAVGYTAGSSVQGTQAVAIGYSAGQRNQGSYGIALGSQTGFTGQLSQAIAIGRQAGFSAQGINSVAIGTYAAPCAQGNNTIVLNATGSTLNTPAGVTSATYISPVRNTTTGTAIGNVAVYNTATKELGYSNTISLAGNVTAGNITVISDVSVAGNVSAGNLITSGNIFDVNALTISTAANNHITLAPDGTANVKVTSNLSASGTVSDSLGSVRNLTAGEATGTALTIPSGTTSDLITFTLPSAGTWLITYSLRAQIVSAGAYVVASITDNSNTLVNNSQALVGYFAGTTFSEFQAPATMAALVTTTGSAVYKIRGRANNASITIPSNNDGVLKAWWFRVSA